MRKIYLVLLTLLTMLAILNVTAFAEEAVEEKPILVFEISRDIVYRGYQSIEVKVYIVTDEPPSLEEAKAILHAGVSISTDLSLVRLAAPAEVRVGNETYTTRYVALARIHVPEAASVGIAKLEVTVTGSVGDREFSDTKTFDITILNHRPVEAARLKAYLALERAKSLLQVAQALGVDVAKEAESLAAIEENIMEADDMLMVREMVEEALEAYTSTTAELEKLSTNIIVKLSSLALKLDEISMRLDAVEARADTLEKSLREMASKLEELSRSVEESLEALRSGLADYGKTLSELSKSINDAVAALAGQVNELGARVSKLTEDTNNAVNTIADGISKLNEKIDEVAAGQAALAQSIGSLQTTVLALAIVILLVAVFNVIALRRLR